MTWERFISTGRSKPRASRRVTIELSSAERKWLTAILTTYSSYKEAKAILEKIELARRR